MRRATGAGLRRMYGRRRLGRVQRQHLGERLGRLAIRRQDRHLGDELPVGAISQPNTSLLVPAGL